MLETLHTKVQFISLGVRNKQHSVLFGWVGQINILGLDVRFRDMTKRQAIALARFLELMPPNENFVPVEQSAFSSVLDSIDLKKAKEHNQRLNEEILALRTRVRSLDSEKKVLGEVVSCLI